MPALGLRCCCGRFVAIWLVGALLASFNCCREAVAQALLAAGANGTFSANAPEEKPVSSFTLPAQSSSVKDAIADFQRFVENEAWEKAFEALDTISSKSTDGFVEQPNGVLVPSRLLVRSLVAGMPTAGKVAYRVFYDAQATTLWDKAKGSAEVENLTKIVEDHLVSSVGDKAADRLGDLYFERGDLHRAVANWRTILTYCPDSEIPKSQLLIKIATAQALGNRAVELAETRSAIQARYANDTVTVGGERLKAGAEAERLAAGVEPTDTREDRAVVADFALPTGKEPLWQFRFYSKPNPNLQNANVNDIRPFPLVDAYGRPRGNDFPIPVATDGERVYVNTFGVEMAFDVASGKLVWRDGRLQELDFQQTRQGALPERYALLVDGNRVWSVTRDPKQMSRQPAMFGIVSRDAATGKELFNSRRMLSTWNIMGTPFLAKGIGNLDQQSTRQPASEHRAPTSGQPAVQFADGFAGSLQSLTLNGNAARFESRMRLTDGHSKQASSFFTTEPVNVEGFKAQFEFHLTKAFADGILFVLQGQGPTAVGKWNNGRNGISFEGISKSVGVKFDIYGEDANSTGLCLDGIRPTADTAISFKDAKINLKNGHIFRVNLSYDGENLRVVTTDTKTNATHTANYPVDIPSHVGGPKAHIGFVGSSGLLTAVQDIVSWTYTPVAPSAVKKAPSPSATAGDMLFVGASPTNKTSELSVLMLDAATGKLKKDVKLGTHAVDPSQLYFDRPSVPTFAMLRDRLYVDTHAGALVALRLDNGAVEWGVSYESPPPNAGYNNYNYAPPQFGVSGPVIAGDLLFAKGMRSPRVVAVEPGGPTLTWVRPVEISAVLIGADEKHLYTGGNELAAYDLVSQELVWSTQLPPSAGWSQPLLTETQIYQFTSRGIYQVDKQTGEVTGLFRGSDLDAFGGALLVTPTALITVSNVAITAYPLKQTTNDVAGGANP